MTSKQRKTIASIGIILIMLAGFVAATIMVDCSIMSKEHGELAFAGTLIIAIAGLTVVLVRK